MSSLIRLLRPSQWIKNFVVFAPVIFGGALTDARAVWAASMVFFAFCLTASSIYCFNDIHDVADDRRHPEKCHRPIASGEVSLPQAYGLMFSLFAAALALLLTCHLTSAAVVVVGYWLMNLAYCIRLKQLAIIDVCIVAFGFVLRMVAGGEATDISLSRWIVLMVFLLMLFMSFAKRRDDVIRMEATGEPPRKNTIHYNTTFINQAITITAAVTLVCYIMYTVSPEVIAQWHSEYLYLTTIFVLLGLLRYIQIAVVEKKSGNPTKIILHDRFVQATVLGWLIAFLLIIYL